MSKVKCEDCKNYLNEWCDKIDDSPYPDIPRNCEYFAKKERYVKKIPSAEPERKKPDHGYMWICQECGLEVHSDFRRCVRCGWDRPSAEPERKTGRWEHIYIKRRGYTRDDRTPRTRESAYCTACRAIVPELKKISRGDSKYRTICNVFNFCPNCGADMRGEEHENNNSR